MKDIELHDTKLESLLNRMSEQLFQRSPNFNQILPELMRKEYDLLIPKISPTSDEYLQKALQMDWDDYGFPRGDYLLSMDTIYRFSDPLIDEKAQSEINDIRLIQDDIIQLYSQKARAGIFALYPKDGYIGWHHNGNVAGYDILMTYSETGDSCFRYWDAKKGVVVELPDKKGWVVRAGLLGDVDSEGVCWHSVVANCRRVTISASFDSYTEWENVIKKITCGQYDESVFNVPIIDIPEPILNDMGFNT